ncbi:MAG: aminotransferase class I/II-fold pyridoxal phosphate-dependent enzyme [Chlamydiota bacterium]|nr:aminotransferase class I/II-fold pyridoxal phosphate-dependent enzyme [Chlamydiota bacterium]
MAAITPQAEKLNQTISTESPVVFELLSDRGKQIFFPHEGILGQTVEAKGVKLNATIGMACEDDGSIMVLDAIAKNISLNKGDVFPYAPSFGKKEVRVKWKEMMLQKNPSLQSEISLPVVTSALTNGLSIAGYLFADEETKIVLADPFWGNYKLIFNVTYGTELVPSTLFKGGSMDVNGLINTLKESQAKILLLNFPNNPCGYTPTNKEVDKIVTELEKYVQDHQLVVLCDDAYFGLVYKEGVYTESIFSRLCNLHENLLAVKLDGCTKEDYVWGFRVGFLTFGIKGGTTALYDALADKTAGAVRGTSSNAPNISQALLLKAFNTPGYEQEKKEKGELLKDRYSELKIILSSHNEYEEYFTALPFNSGYFMCVQLMDNLNAEEVRKHLLKKYDTGLISLGTMIRVAFSSVGADKLQQIFDNLYATCKELSQ